MERKKVDISQKRGKIDVKGSSEEHVEFMVDYQKGAVNEYRRL